MMKFIEVVRNHIAGERETVFVNVDKIITLESTIDNGTKIVIEGAVIRSVENIGTILDRMVGVRHDDF